MIESTGSGGGLKLFCSGVGVNYPDITNASRRIKSSEVKLCAKNGVKDITEVKVGFDGIVMANAKNGPQMKAYPSAAVPCARQAGAGQRRW